MHSHLSLKQWLAGIALGSMSALALAVDECGEAPVAPELPDGATATLEELVQASDAVKDYIATADGYLDCKESFAKDRAFKNLAKDEQDALREEVSAVTASRNQVGELFNAEVEAYRQANPE